MSSEPEASPWTSPKSTPPPPPGARELKRKGRATPGWHGPTAGPRLCRRGRALSVLRLLLYSTEEEEWLRGGQGRRLRDLSSFQSLELNYAGTLASSFCVTLSTVFATYMLPLTLRGCVQGHRAVQGVGLGPEPPAACSGQNHVVHTPSGSPRAPSRLGQIGLWPLLLGPRYTPHPQPSLSRCCPQSPASRQGIRPKPNDGQFIVTINSFKAHSVFPQCNGDATPPSL